MAGQGNVRPRRTPRPGPVRIAVLTLCSLLLSGAAGAAAYFFPVFVAGMRQTGQTVIVAPSRSPGVKSTATPSAAPGAPFTVLLLGSDDDSKFKADRVLTQSMILVRVEPATKHVTMLSIPRDLWVPLEEKAKTLIRLQPMAISRSRSSGANGHSTKRLSVRSASD
jgi:anionic cell wall polymer biosynthesis LytR-Cps2A-Psr (LCP) family protein